MSKSKRNKRISQRTGAEGEELAEKQTDSEMKAPDPAALDAIVSDAVVPSGGVKVPIFESGDELKIGGSSEDALKIGAGSPAPPASGVDDLGISDIRPIDDFTSGGEKPAAPAAPAPSSSDAATAALEAPPAAAASPRTASGKLKAISGKAPAAPSGREPAVPLRAPSGKTGAVAGRAAAVSGRPAAGKITSSRRVLPEAAAAPPRIASGQLVWVICRECLEEWTIDPVRAKAQETIACPVCEHRSQAPSDDILHQIALYKGIEQKNFTIAAASLGTGLFAMLLWTLLTTNPSRADNAAVMIGLPVIAFISLIATFAFTSKYENSRWETYF